MSLEILGQDPEEAPCSIDGFGDANRTQLDRDYVFARPSRPGAEHLAQGSSLFGRSQF